MNLGLEIAEHVIKITEFLLNLMSATQHLETMEVDHEKYMMPDIKSNSKQFTKLTTTTI